MLVQSFASTTGRIRIDARSQYLRQLTQLLSSPASCFTLFLNTGYTPVSWTSVELSQGG